MIEKTSIARRNQSNRLRKIVAVPCHEYGFVRDVFIPGGRDRLVTRRQT